MNLLSVLKGLLTLANLIAKYLNDKQLLEAGEYKQIAKSNEEALNAIRKAQDARANLKHDAGSVWDDPANRDKHE